MIFHPPWGVHLLCVFFLTQLGHWVVLVNLNFGLHPAAATMNDMDVSSRKKLLTWLRLGCVVMAVAALLFVFSRINLVELLHALRSARPDWLLAAVAVYGLVFLPGAWRFQHPDAAAQRLRGPSWGDRHTHDFDRSFFLHHVLWRDWRRLCQVRALRSLVSTPAPANPCSSRPAGPSAGFGRIEFLFIVLAFGLAALNGAFARLGAPSLNLPPRRVALVVLLIALLCVALKRWGPRSALALLQAFQQAGGRLLRSWTSTWQGLACGFLVQVVLALSLAPQFAGGSAARLCLGAICSGPFRSSQRPARSPSTSPARVCAKARSWACLAFTEFPPLMPWPLLYLPWSPGCFGPRWGESSCGASNVGNPPIAPCPRLFPSSSPLSMMRIF